VASAFVPFHECGQKNQRILTRRARENQTKYVKPRNPSWNCAFIRARRAKPSLPIRAILVERRQAFRDGQDEPGP
jgi:hypothetical protein